MGIEGYDHCSSCLTASFSAPFPDRTRSPVNARPAPVRGLHPCRACRAPFSVRFLVWRNEPIRHERNLSWHALQPQQPPSTAYPHSKHDTSPTRATKAFEPKFEPHGPTATAKACRSSLKFCPWTVTSFFVSPCPRLAVRKRALSASPCAEISSPNLRIRQKRFGNFAKSPLRKHQIGE